MPWEKQFDVDTALSQAMETFWSKGYEATSVNDLVDAMGINRGSLYDTFGDKHSLFVSALKHYDHWQKGPTLKQAALNRTPRETIKFLFDSIAREAVDKHRTNGCFLVNSMLELGPHDEEVRAYVSKSLSGIQRYFRDLIRHGQRSGDIRQTLDAADVAAALLALLIGLRVLSRGNPGRTTVRAIAQQAIALVE